MCFLTRPPYSYILAYEVSLWLVRNKFEII
jgi:hypothetical protein